MFFITTNRAATQIKYRVEFVDGVEYWVAPLTMMVPGVLTGSKGPTLYTANELMKAAPRWDMMPITVGHPKDSRGNFISANSDEVLKRSQIGYVSKPRWEGKLVAEAWIDIEEARRIDNRIATALAANAVMEVSTGLFHDVDSRSGLCNGKPFTHSAINHQPDHLAILPDEKGACSVACGCGLNANSTPKDPLRLPEWNWGNPNPVSSFPQQPTPAPVAATPKDPLRLPEWNWINRDKPNPNSATAPIPVNVPESSKGQPLTTPVWTWERK